MNSAAPTLSMMSPSTVLILWDSPKSMSLISNRRLLCMTTLSGCMLRWTIPRWCKNWTASSSCSQTANRSDRSNTSVHQMSQVNSTDLFDCIKYRSNRSVTADVTPETKLGSQSTLFVVLQTLPVYKVARLTWNDVGKWELSLCSFSLHLKSPRSLVQLFSCDLQPLLWLLSLMHPCNFVWPRYLLCDLSICCEPQSLVWPQYLLWTSVSYVASVSVVNLSLLCGLSICCEPQSLVWPQYLLWTSVSCVASVSVVNLSLLCGLRIIPFFISLISLEQECYI